MVEILEKNLEVISKYNKALVEKIQSITELKNNISLGETLLKEPNLIFNGVLLHDMNGAEKEANQRFMMQLKENTPLSIHLVYGFGLGYLPQAAIKQSQGSVIIFEPNIELLRAVLEIVDFSEEFSNKNVFLTSDLDEINVAISKVFKYRSNVELVYLKSYEQINKEELKNNVKKINLVVGTFIVGYNTLTRENTKMLTSQLNNFSRTLDLTPLHNSLGMYAGKTALIVSAGPTLDKNIETIKNNRDKFIIFCVGTALRTIMEAGITPDYLNIVEVHDNSSQTDGLDLTNVSLILEPFTHESHYKLKVKEKFLFISADDFSNQIWAKYTGVDISQYSSRGTVSYEALQCARILGFTTIILVGQDLAFIEGQCYSKGTNYKDLICAYSEDKGRYEIKPKDIDSYIKLLFADHWNNHTYEQKLGIVHHNIKVLNDSLMFIQGIQGKLIPTAGGYATFIEQIRKFAVENPELNLINTSMYGAQIDGFKNIPLEEAVKDLPDVKKILLKHNAKYDIEGIYKEFENQLNVLAEISKLLLTGEDCIKQYNKDFSLRNTLTEKSMKLFRNALATFYDLNQQYIKKSEYFANTTLSDYFEVQNAIDSAGKVDAISIQAIISRLDVYFTNSYNKTEDLKKNIIKTREDLRERISTKS